MPRLSVIHFGIHQNLKQIPPLSGVPNLQSLTLAWVTQLHEVPRFDGVPKLRRLILLLLARLERLPDMSPLRDLDEFIIYRPSHICCNGFVGPCDLGHTSCQSNALLHTPPAACLTNDKDPNLAVTPFQGSAATEKLFKKFAPFICGETLFDRLSFLTFPTKETIKMCDGKPFRQCVFPGSIAGICYYTRFQVLSCLPDADYIALRRRQIEKGVGPKCDPIEEKWLGC